MSETRRSPAEPLRPTISHDEAIKYPEIRALYTNERIAMRDTGQPVWMVPGFEGEKSSLDEGIVLYYYQGGGLRGYVEGNDLDGYQVYGPETEEDEGPHHLNTEPVGLLSEAQKILADYIEQTYLKYEQ